jgi:hypothetical protein
VGRTNAHPLLWRWLDHRYAESGEVPLNRTDASASRASCADFSSSGRKQIGVQEEAEAILERVHEEAGTGEALRFCCGEMGNPDLLLHLAHWIGNLEFRARSFTEG